MCGRSAPMWARRTRGQGLCHRRPHRQPAQPEVEAVALGSRLSAAIHAGMAVGGASTAASRADTTQGQSRLYGERRGAARFAKRSRHPPHSLALGLLPHLCYHCCIGTVDAPHPTAESCVRRGHCKESDAC